MHSTLYKVKDLLKEKFLATENNSSKEFDKNHPYYLKNLEDNLVQPMSEAHLKQYSNGSEDELNQNAGSSSSAMTFNLLGNEWLQIKNNSYLPNGKYSISYEFQLPTLSGNKGKPANLDALLNSEINNSCIFCEMKMTEYLSSPSRLKEAYLNFKSYELTDENAANVFIDVFKQLICTADKSGSYKSKYKRYDAFQMLKHPLAIYNNIGKLKRSKIVLLNCVWEMKKQENKTYSRFIEKELEEFKNFYSHITPKKELFSSKGVNFDILYLSFAQVLRLLEKDNETMMKLKRYEL